MPPQLLFDLNKIDLENGKNRLSVEQVEANNPHRGHMRLIDGVLYAPDDFSRIVTYKEIGDDEFWVAGHIPGRPVFPGVLMIEAAAQTASLCYKMRFRDDGVGNDFLGFVGADNVKFRGQVVPGDRLYILGQEVKFNRRRFICDLQGVVNDTQVFEARISGMPI